MLRPCREILFNSRLNYRAYIYGVDGALHRLAPKGARFAMSLLPNLATAPHPATIFAWTATAEPDRLYASAIESGEFMALLQETIRMCHEELRYLLSSRAQRQVDGWLSIVDDRAPLVYGRAPEPDDTIGMCRAELGQVLPETYAPMPSYRLVSRLGIFSLPRPLHAAVLSRLEHINSSNK